VTNKVARKVVRQNSNSKVLHLSAAWSGWWLMMMFMVHCRLICEALLSSDKLSYQNSESWCMTLKLVRRIIGGVDYKVQLQLFSYSVYNNNKIIK